MPPYSIQHKKKAPFEQSLRQSAGMISLYRKIQKSKSGEQGIKQQQQQQPPCAHQRNGTRAATSERPNVPTSVKSAQGLQPSTPTSVAVAAPDAEPERHSTPQSSQITDSKCEACVEEKRAARKYRFKLVIGLIFPFALQALDVTMYVQICLFPAEILLQSGVVIVVSNQLLTTRLLVTAVSQALYLGLPRTSVSIYISIYINK